MWFRAATLAVFLPIGIAYVLWRRQSHRLESPPGSPSATQDATDRRLEARQVLVLILTGLAIGAMLLGVERWSWGNAELSAMYIALALAIAVVGRVGSREASQAFIKGMQ